MSTHKQFLVTISMYHNIYMADYAYIENEEREGVVVTSRFPGIPLLKMNLKKDDDFEVVVLWTKKEIPDKDGNILKPSEVNKALFYEELAALSSETGIDFTGKIREVEIPYDEGKSKQMAFFKQICETYTAESDLYVDLTYGSKMTIMNLFASIVYAEKVSNCYIKELSYGAVNFADKSGKIYDVRPLYEINTLIQNVSNIPNVNVNHVFNLFGV